MSWNSRCHEQFGGSSQMDQSRKQSRANWRTQERRAECSLRDRFLAPSGAHSICAPAKSSGKRTNERRGEGRRGRPMVRLAPSAAPTSCRLQGTHPGTGAHDEVIGHRTWITALGQPGRCIMQLSKHTRLAGSLDRLLVQLSFCCARGNGNLAAKWRPCRLCP